MTKIKSIDNYIGLHPQWVKELKLICSILDTTELNSSIKWNVPVYSVNGKNVLGIGAFKKHLAIWFFNGVCLSDPENILTNAQKNKTKALRQLRYYPNESLDPKLIKTYVLEAIDNEKKGIKPVPDKKEKSAVAIPDLLLEQFKKDEKIKKQFFKLSPYKQKEYCEYLESAKRETTKRSRLEKIIPMIETGAGLNDRYRK